MLYWKKSKNRNPNPYWRSKHRQAKGKVKYFQKLEKKKNWQWFEQGRYRTRKHRNTALDFMKRHDMTFQQTMTQRGHEKGN